jgi:hypothetical protein
MMYRIFAREEWGASAFASSSIPSCCSICQFMNLKANSSSIQTSHQDHLKARRVTRRSQKPSYGLTNAEITPELGQELAEFYRFMTEGDVNAPEVKPITAVTAKNYLIQVRQFLGWMHRHRTPVVPLSQLRLSELFVPSGLRAQEAFREKETRLQIANVKDYLQWLRLEREVAPSYELQVVKALVWVVRFLESVFTHQVLKRRSRKLPSRWSRNCDRL